MMIVWNTCLSERIKFFNKQKYISDYIQNAVFISKSISKELCKSKDTYLVYQHIRAVSGRYRYVCPAYMPSCEVHNG